MQKAKNIITALLTLLFMGGLHHVNQKSREVETVTVEQDYMNQLPNRIPYEVPQPMVGFPIY